MHDYFTDYIIQKSFLTSGLCNPEVFFSNAFPDYIIQKLLYESGTRRIKMYFHVVYEGAKRTYGGAGRNSHNECMTTSMQ